MKDSLLNDPRPFVAVFDVKILGEHTNAYIAAIGCVIKDVEKDCEVAAFYARFGANDVSQSRRHKDPKALAWWQDQRVINRDAWTELFEIPTKDTLDKALVRLERFLSRETPQGSVLQVVGKGPAQDAAVLAQAYGQFGLPMPWLQKNAHQLDSILLIAEWANGDPESLKDIMVERSGFANHDARRDAERLMIAILFLRRLKEKAGECDTLKKNNESLKHSIKVAGDGMHHHITLMQAAVIDCRPPNLGLGIKRIKQHLSQFGAVPTAEQMASVKGCGATWYKQRMTPPKTMTCSVDVSADRFEYEVTPFSTVEANA